MAEDSAEMWFGLNVKWSALWWFLWLLWCIGDETFVPELCCALVVALPFCWMRSLLLLEHKFWEVVDVGDVREGWRNDWCACGFERWMGDAEGPFNDGEFWIPFEEYEVFMLDVLWFASQSGLELGLFPSKVSRIDNGGGARKNI